MLMRDLVQLVKKRMSPGPRRWQPSGSLKRYVTGLATRLDRAEKKKIEKGSGR